jgi:hypothetical protein
MIVPKKQTTRIMVGTIVLITTTSLLLLLVVPPTGQAQEVYPGVWASREVSALPLPVSGRQVYLVGEMHGVKETEGILRQYLDMLHRASGLRDVAIEEDAVYQAEAEAYVEGKASVVPEPLCLRAGFLSVIRQFNEGRGANDRVRIHLVDIDTPATAVRHHLCTIKDRVRGAEAVRVPDVVDIRDQGLKAVEELKRLTADALLLRELRTVEHSIRAYQQGLEVGTRGFKGSPYLDDREQAIASNIQDVLGDKDCRGLLALYGSDHVSKAPRKDGGPNRDRPFSPMALRLEQAGVQVFSLVTFPLSGRWRWRGHEGEMLWNPAEGRLSTGEGLDQVLAAWPDAMLFYIDRKRQRITLPSRDVTGFRVDAFLLLVKATAMDNYCGNP